MCAQANASEEGVLKPDNGLGAAPADESRGTCMSTSMTNACRLATHALHSAIAAASASVGAAASSSERRWWQKLRPLSYACLLVAVEYRLLRPYNFADPDACRAVTAPWAAAASGM